MQEEVDGVHRVQPQVLTATSTPAQEKTLAAMFPGICRKFDHLCPSNKWLNDL